MEDFSKKGFINNAFTKKAIESINTVTVDNSAQSAIDSNKDLKESISYKNYACENTKDKIFLLSKNEVTRKSYGFPGENIWGEESYRLRKTTDYSRAIGAYPDMDYKDFKNNGNWWLRSPYYKYSNCPESVSIHGKSDGGSDGSISGWGIVPALSINISSIKK